MNYYDTFGRVFALLDPDEFRRCFLSWTQAVVGAPGDRVVAIGGKTPRRSHDRRGGKSALQLVSAWATANGLVLGQVATVTIDAMGCQTAIATPIVTQGADYVLALKDNPAKLHARVRLAFADANAAVGTTLPLADLKPHTTRDTGHGRIERRRCLAIDDPASLAFIEPDGAWPHLTSVVLIESTRRVGTTVSTEARHDLSKPPGQRQGPQRRYPEPGGIENRLPWVLDVAFREDACRVRIGHAPENLAIVRHCALNLLRQEPSRPASVAT